MDLLQRRSKKSSYNMEVAVPAGDSVMRDFIEDTWHYRNVVTGKAGLGLHEKAPAPGHLSRGSSRGVETVDAFEISDGRDSDQSWTPTSDSDSASLCRSFTGCSSSSTVSDRRSISDASLERTESLFSTRSRTYTPEVLEMKRVFDTYDDNGDGQICKVELGNFMKKLGSEVSEEELTCMMNSADKNGDGCVDFDEFLELHDSMSSGEFGEAGLKGEESQGKPDKTDEADLRDAFLVFDKNADGFISAIELQSVLRNLRISTNTKLIDCEKMISGVDKNGDGQVDFAEFKHLMASLSGPS